MKQNNIQLVLRQKEKNPKKVGIKNSGNKCEVYNKCEEDTKRFQIFRKTLMSIILHNKIYCNDINFSL